MKTQTRTTPDTACLVNISAQVWPPRHRTYFGSLVVCSPENGATFAVTPIHACKGVMDLGDKRTMEFSITAREIAEDIARELNNDSGDGSFHGVFVTTAPARELAAAKREAVPLPTNSATRGEIRFAVCPSVPELCALCDSVAGCRTLGF